MTAPEYPDAPPPEVPEEFAAVYREAYRRALEDGAGVSVAAPDVASARGPVAQQTTAVIAPEPGVRPPASGADVLARWRASRWFIPAAAAVGAAVLLGAAYAVGTSYSGDDRLGADGAMSPQSSRTTGSAKTPSSHQARPKRVATAPHGWTGRLEAVRISAVAADCTAPPGTDSGGHAVTYEPENAADGKADTAWRCTGSAVGRTLVLRLAGATEVGEVGLVPGYAKTDPVSGADRYAENNRITRVRWTFGDGTTLVQRLDPDPSSRVPQLLRVPRTTTDRIVLEILAVRQGSRDTTAISEISIAEAR